ncbi:3-hydroxyisobutyrate dehydrogenase-like beta-hydroxyacid dehydrogenase [Cupriavidus gilardii J11]|uniref:3-hydroxyisobutyrate dehydrogenase-like beta-hydroxyacid dehydrogenase n=1 Tax=Cupriavidus gilardii J11 TaxID=936133 RepID=A0A562BVT0_9BURK|nr:NAD(P)-dependent oxidoreductase [Cupriavidus gilardii]TWG88900.1 3-hydroxyisobutyrate dehydrogenase-like beta-hydroxyacid dehydrogenase [Cupriavidus gilardii J11]
MSNGVDALGFVGVGVMGEGMCRNLVRKCGLPVYVADLDADNVARVAAHGAVPSSIAGIRRTAGTVFLSLPSIDQVEEVCFGEDPLIVEGGSVRTVVDMSTSDVPRTRALAQRLATHGVSFVDAPVARSREAANSGTLLITVGGTVERFEAVAPWLRCMGSDVVHCGDVGAGQVVKIMNNMVLLSTVNALAEAMAIAEASGVDKAMLANVLKLGSADSFALRLTGEKLARDEFPEKMFPAAYALKDMRLALKLAQSSGIQPRVAEATATLLGQAVDRGYGMNYYPVVYRLIRP